MMARLKRTDLTNWKEESSNVTNSHKPYLTLNEDDVSNVLISPIEGRGS